MDITFAIIAVVVVVLVIALLKLAKVAVKWIIIIAVIVAILSFFGINVIEDVKDLQENFPKAQNIILLKENNNLLAGFTGSLINNKGVSYVSSEQLSVYSKQYNDKDFNSIKSNYYKLIFADVSMFDDDVNFNNRNISAEAAVKLVKSDNTFEDSVSLIISQENLIENNNLREYIKGQLKNQNGIGNSTEMRALIFAQLLNSADSSTLLAGLKNDKLVVYPSTITFKLIKFMPSILSENILKKMVVVK